MVLDYADQIFQTGRELIDAVRGRPTGRALTLRVGDTARYLVKNPFPGATALISIVVSSI